MSKRRVVVAVAGATGVIYAVQLLRHIQNTPDIESHLIVSPSAVLNLQHELSWSKDQLTQLADVTHAFHDIGDALASGSYTTTGMIITPCSMRTLAAVAHGLSDNLITRAADVHLKERRPLLLAVRETPFNLAHLRNMTAVTEMGGIIFPPLPAFYHHPQTIDDIVQHHTHRMLQLIGIEQAVTPWQGLR